MSDGHPTTLLPPSRSLAMAAIILLAMAGTVMATASIASDGTLDTLSRVVLIAAGGAFALGLALVAARLAIGRGGLYGRSDAIGFGITAPADIWWIPRADISGISVAALPDPPLDPNNPLPPMTDAERTWIVSVVLNRGVSIVLAAVEGLSMADGVAEQFQQLLETSRCPAPTPIEPPTLPMALNCAVRRKSALHWPLLVFGISFLATGALMFMRMEAQPVVGFLVGPLFGLLGLTLVSAAVVKHLTAEQLHGGATGWRREFSLFGRRWGSALVSGPGQWRITLHGLRGGALEWVTDTGLLVMGAGATSRSDCTIDALSRIPQRADG